ncbi:KLK14 protein, partial [Tricholaema leucomelas]|nr:KLK14 protein [Tricholaema leucomelas]
LGSDTLQEGSGQVRRIQRLKVHPRYDPGRNDNDFMLLRLDRPAALGPRVKSIPLASSCPSPGASCSVSGWGTTKSP